MIVAVQVDMLGLKAQLEKAGYTVVFANERLDNVDAVIVSGRKGYSLHPFIEFQAYEAVDYFTGTNIYHGNNYRKGALEINADNKSFEEIERLLSAGKHNVFFF